MTMYCIRPRDAVHLVLNKEPDGVIDVRMEDGELIVELSPEMGAALLGLLRHFADKGKINPQRYTSADVWTP